MEIPLIFSVPNPGTTAFSSCCRVCVCDFPVSLQRRKSKKKWVAGKVGGFKVVAERSSEGIDGGERKSGGGYTSSAMEVSTFNQSFGDEEFPVWEKIGAVVRLSYGIGIYGAMALAGRFVCSITGTDCMGGFQPSLNAIVEGLVYAFPPIMALLFILDDEVVKVSPHARAIRDVEDEELRSFFDGMSPWQFILVVAASSVGEELFYRAAVQMNQILSRFNTSAKAFQKPTIGIRFRKINTFQIYARYQFIVGNAITIAVLVAAKGALANIFLRGTDFVTDARGMVSLTGVLPPFVPFAQAFAAVITAVLTGSLYYMAASPKDPTYIVAPVLQSRSGRQDLKKLFTAWYERRQMKKIYSPLLEGFLALYLGFEWIKTNNILAPIITHGIYSTVILGHGLWKIHDHRKRLRQRIQQVKLEGEENKF